MQILLHHDNIFLAIHCEAVAISMQQIMLFPTRSGGIEIRGIEYVEEYGIVVTALPTEGCRMLQTKNASSELARALPNTVHLTI
jgi:hypothetical protein